MADSAVENDVQLDSGDYLRTWLKIPSLPDQGEDTVRKNMMQLLDPESYIKAYWNADTRPDGRLFSQARPTRVVSSLLKHSAGSALVKQGETKVLSAMTIQVGQPAPELPDHGDVVVSVTTPDQARHSDALQSWLQRMLDDTLPPRLNLLTGKACLRIVVTVLLLQDDGNLKDTTLLACMAAWKNTKLPTMEDFVEVEGRLYWKEAPKTSIDRESETDKENNYRISVTMGILRHAGTTRFLVDPSVDEEAFTEGSLTIVVDLLSRKLQLDYSGGVPLNTTDIALAVKMANGRADELSRLLQGE